MSAQQTTGEHRGPDFGQFTREDCFTPGARCLSDSNPSLRIVHAANYQLKKDGAEFFNWDLKLHQGLVQNGHFVYPFSINDRARMLSPLGHKLFGSRGANAALLRTCRSVRPDILILGHAQLITRQTLQTIRQELPNIRIGLWYVDPIWDGSDIGHIHDRADLLNGVFCTAGGKPLKAFCRPGCPAAFVPNPVERGVERCRAFDEPNPEYDVVFIGRDKHIPDRRRYLQRLVDSLPEVRFGMFGCLGNPLIFGDAKEQVLAKSRMALNISRRTDIELYSSDRIAQMTGNGILTLTPSGSGLEQLYTQDDVAYFSDFDDLVACVRRLCANDAERIRIARNGWRKSHTEYSAAEVARFIVNVALRRSKYRQAAWSDHIFLHDADPPWKETDEQGFDVAA